MTVFATPLMAEIFKAERLSRLGHRVVRKGFILTFKETKMIDNKEIPIIYSSVKMSTIFRRFADELDKNQKRVDAEKIIKIVGDMRSYAWCVMGGVILVARPEDTIANTPETDKTLKGETE